MKTIKLILICTAALAVTSCGGSGDDGPAEKAGAYGRLLTGAMKKAQGMEDILNIKHHINLFHSEAGRFPNALDELVEAGYINEIPAPPPGMEFLYDPGTGEINLGESRND